MAYVNLNFVPGEILTAAKMNLLAANDASFHDGTGIGDGSIQSKNINVATILASKEYDKITELSGALTIQTGWTQFIGSNTANNKRFVTPIVFPKQYKKVCFVSCSFIGYKGGAEAKDIHDFTTAVGEGNSIEPNNITDTGCDLVATSRGGMGAAWHGILWVAVGII